MIRAHRSWRVTEVLDGIVDTWFPIVAGVIRDLSGRQLHANKQERRLTSLAAPRRSVSVPLRRILSIGDTSLSTRPINRGLDRRSSISVRVSRAVEPAWAATAFTAVVDGTAKGTERDFDFELSMRVASSSSISCARLSTGSCKSGSGVSSSSDVISG